jgi:hypothetical protein
MIGNRNCRKNRRLDLRREGFDARAALRLSDVAGSTAGLPGAVCGGNSPYIVEGEENEPGDLDNETSYY